GGPGGLGSAPAPGGPFPPLPAFTPANIPVAPFALAPDHSMLDLFREETRGHLLAISKALPALPTDPTAAEPLLESLKQIRGAARLVKCERPGTREDYRRVHPRRDRYSTGSRAGSADRSRGARRGRTYPPRPPLPEGKGG